MTARPKRSKAETAHLRKINKAAADTLKALAGIQREDPFSFRILVDQMSFRRMEQLLAYLKRLQELK